MVFRSCLFFSANISDSARKVPNKNRNQSLGVADTNNAVSLFGHNPVTIEKIECQTLKVIKDGPSVLHCGQVW